MKPHVKKYLKELERHILTVGSQDILTEYRTHFFSLLSQQFDIDCAIDGFDTLKTLQAVRNSLQHIATVYAQHAIAPQIWNRFVASSLQALIDTNSSVSDHQIVKKKTGHKTEAVVKSTPIRTDVVAYNKTLSPRSSVPAKKDLPLAPLEESTPVEIRRQVETTLKQYKKHPFFNSPAVKCRDPLCRFCITCSIHVPLTSCKSRKSHGKGKCHSSGFWPHVGSTLWAKWKHPHNAGAAFSLSTPLAIPEGGLPPINHNPTDATPVVASVSVEDGYTSCSDSSISLSGEGSWARVAAKRPRPSDTSAPRTPLRYSLDEVPPAMD